MLVINLYGCSEGEIWVTGTVTDKTTEDPIKDVNVQVIYTGSQEDSFAATTKSDSLGEYFAWNFMGCGLSRCRFAVLFSKNGYKSQVFEMKGFVAEFDVEMEPE